MGILTRSYFARNRRAVLVGALSGVILAALFGLRPHSVAYLFPWLVVQPFLTCPLTLRTPAGRLWWAAYACLPLSLAVVSLVRLPHPLAWAGLVACTGCGVLTVSLRWNTPPAGTG